MKWEVTPDIRVLLDACRADGRATYAVGSLATAEGLQTELGAGVIPTEAFAVRTGLTPAWEAFKELRRHRWLSAKHAERLWHECRKPKIRLTKKDVVVVEARLTNLHAVARIVKRAKRAGATLIVIGPMEPSPRALAAIRNPSHERDRS